MCFLALGIALKADELSVGDRHAVELSQFLDATIAAQIAFEHRLESARPSAEVAEALNVLADCYDDLCMKLSQFSFWVRSPYFSPDAFSTAGVMQLGRFQGRLEAFAAAHQLTPRQEALLALHQNDAAVTAAAAKIASSVYTMQKLIRQAESGYPPPWFLPTAQRI
jgi:hypothetical protein